VPTASEELKAKKKKKSDLGPPPKTEFFSPPVMEKRDNALWGVALVVNRTESSLLCKHSSKGSGRRVKLKSSVCQNQIKSTRGGKRSYPGVLGKKKIFGLWICGVRKSFGQGQARGDSTGCSDTLSAGRQSTAQGPKRLWIEQFGLRGLGGKRELRRGIYLYRRLPTLALKKEQNTSLRKKTGKR